MFHRSFFKVLAAVVFISQLGACANGMMDKGMSGETGSTGSTSQASPTGTAMGGVPPGAVVLSGTCNAAAAAYAVGQQATAALQSELITKTLAKTLRVVRPGEMVTQEFSSQRLNLDVDGNGRITAARCG
jgi:hypothetical protein